MSAPYWQLTVPVTTHISEALTNLVWELGALGVVEDGVLRAFFPPDAMPSALRARVRAYLSGLCALGYAVESIAPTVAPLADEAWAEAWKAHFRPIEVGRRLLVAPPWDVPATSRLTLVIEPGRAFGTGHHGSTAGCLTLIEKLCEQERIARALDLGTGSGLLAIAAARLGVPEVLAVDKDPDAIAAAIANAARNGVPDRVRCAVADAAALPASRFPLVLANLLATAHLALRVRYRRLLCPGGTLVLGGILEEEVGAVIDALAAVGFLERDRKLLDGWASLALRRP